MLPASGSWSSIPIVVLPHTTASSSRLLTQPQKDCCNIRSATAPWDFTLSQGETRLLCQIIGGLLSFHTVCGIELWQKHVEARTRACTDLAKQDTNTKPLGVINQSSWPKLPATEPPFRGGKGRLIVGQARDWGSGKGGEGGGGREELTLWGQGLMCVAPERRQGLIT